MKGFIREARIRQESDAILVVVEVGNVPAGSMVIDKDGILYECSHINNYMFDERVVETVSEVGKYVKDEEVLITYYCGWLDQCKYPFCNGACKDITQKRFINKICNSLKEVKSEIEKL